ncbi:MAG: hypothetical protein KFF50_05690 [Desulfatitalea sp.]|nr:hypothetical protein [Desulfatitalea sp.]
MPIETFELWMIPLGSLAATLLLWGFYAGLTHLMHRLGPKGGRSLSESEGNRPMGMMNPGAGDDAVKTRVRNALALVVITPLVFFAGHATAAFGHIGSGMEAAVMGSISGGGLLGVALWRWRQAVGDWHDMQWRTTATAMVADAIALIRQGGHHVYPDVTVQGGTIDYLIVNAKGVFALFAVTPPAPPESRRRADNIVVYDGHSLRFPTTEDPHTIPHIEALTENLSEWLGRALETPIAARAIVALPGWQVKRITAHGSSVIHPNQLTSFFQYVKPRSLELEEHARITQLLTASGTAAQSPNPGLTASSA